MRESSPQFSCYGQNGTDTVIGGIRYHQLFHSDDDILNPSEYCGGLREDVFKRIFFYNAATKSEYLLYDFSVRPGDIIDVGMGFTAKVGIIDSVIISGVYHKRINFQTLDGHDWPGGSWIEGIGNSNTGGLLGSVMAQPTCDCATNLICFKERNDFVYHNPKYDTRDCFGQSVSVPEPDPGTSYQIFPNPVTGTSWLRVTDFSGELSLFDISGRLIYRAALSPLQPLQVSNGDFSPGMYYYRITDPLKPASYSGKFQVR